MPHTQHPIEILRFNTCGSVDDGKSTLIGRLLYDSKSLMEDQLEALERSADITGGGQINLANLTDGLRAEREQGITIDVAYRYFATPKRKCVRRHGQWLPVTDLLPPKPKEKVQELVVRVRTIGDIISTGMVESPADSVDDIIAEIAAARVTERGSRADDKASEAAMEDRKKAGYF
jgi:3'-phosphoadenosine 5'-phosphosulfate sulfotransferase (PAPS reductase)/FAD synthetase